ncbi:DNA mismatch repair protein MutL [Actinomycetes bacterium KLBMP 9797]
MPRAAVMSTLGWCAATLASIGVATVALQPVLRTATPDPAEPPPALTAEAPLRPAPSPYPPPSPAPSPAPSASSGARESASSTPPRTTATPAATATIVDGWTVTTGADGQPTYLRSFRTCGGRAVIRMTPGQVRLVSATPDPGFAVSSVQNEPDNLAVQFTEQNHYCIVHAMWHNNAPYAQVSEVGADQ